MLDSQEAPQRTLRASTREARQARHDFQCALQADRGRWIHEAGTTIEALMEYGKIKEVWDHISRWYCQVKVKKTPSTREVLEQVSTERVDIYRCRPLEGLRVPLLMRTA